MKAFVRHEYGGPESLVVEDVPVPTAGDGEVLVQMRAAAVNPYDWHIMRGEPYVLRVSVGLRRPKTTRGIGIDVAGTVSAVGPNVTRFAVGDDVFGLGSSTVAEFALVPEAQLAIKPAGLSFDAAAALPCAGLTALQGLRDKGRVTSGTTVLINGAAGGVGTFAVQIAKALGATVCAVCGPANVDFVRSIGADSVVDYTHDDFSRRGDRFDVVMDTVGNRSLSALRRTATPRGTIVIVGGGSGKWIRPLMLFVKALLVRRFVRQSFGIFMAKATTADLTTLADFVTSGQVSPVVSRTYSFDDLADAISHVEEGHARGKVIVTA